MKFAPLTYSCAINSYISNQFKGSEVPHSDIVRNYATQMIHELINKMSDMDIPENLYITITVNDNPNLPNDVYDVED